MATKLGTEIGWIEITSAMFYSLEEKKPGYLYFLTDTKEIFKGDKLYSGNIEYVSELPKVNINVNKLYILPSGYGFKYNGFTWDKILYGIESVLDDSVNTQFGAVSGEAIKQYIKDKITKTDITSIITPVELSVTGQDIGSYKDGDKIAKDTDFLTIMKNILAKRIPAIYSLPVLNFNISNTTIESGTTVSVNLIPTFIKNDGGDCYGYTVDKIYNGVTSKVVNLLEPTPYTESNIQILDGESLKFTGGVSYNDGPVKKDNLGDDSPEGKIMKGIIYNTIIYKGVRSYFYGTKTTPVEIDNANIRALEHTLSPSNGTRKALSIPTGTKQIIFAYPATLRDITSIVSSGLNLDVKEAFTLSRVSVAGNENYSPIEYKVYSYTPAIPFSNNDTYTFTI